jgi:NADH dehydrogenase [ubiquinone] 1 alpha subcomplex assembly factor 7
MIPPERLDRWMARRVAAYYATQDPFADFTTAPEITQAFGECLGAWAVAAWMGMGRPDPVILAEAGPGRGTLMADALRAAGQVAPGFRAALRLHLVETSARLRSLQAGRLAAHGPLFHERVETLPDGPLILLGNEVLDALPIRQFRRQGGTWRERFVVAAGHDGRLPEGFAAPGGGGTEGRGDAAAAASEDARPAGRDGPAAAARDTTGATTPAPLGHRATPAAGTAPPGPEPAALGAATLLPPAWRLIEGPPAPPCPPLPTAAPEGAVAEVSDAARTLVATLAARLARQPGVALFLDYGPGASGFGDTLQAMRAGRAADPLGPDPADLTAHVDAAALAAVARAAGADAFGPLPQGVFLGRIGLATRAAMLAAADGARGARHLAAAQRLMAPEAMGRLFKALALASPGCGPPAGFDEKD